MYSRKLWHFGMTAFVVVILMALSISHIFSGDAKWEQASAKGLQQKIGLGLEQIYWQWQNEGRPSEILYRPENATQAVIIKLRKDGKPEFALSHDNCRKFLNWFVQDVSLDQFVNVRVEGSQDPQKTGDSSQTNRRACSYTMANHSFAYDLKDAQLRSE